MCNMPAPTSRKSAADAFSRRTPWPGFRGGERPSPRRLLVSAIVALTISTYWAVSAATSSGWPLLLNLACAASGTLLAAYYTREWLKARSEVPVSW